MNMRSPSRSARSWDRSCGHEVISKQSRTDLRNTDPDARPHLAAQFSEGISNDRTLLPRLSPYRLPAGSSALSTSSRSPSPRLVPLAVRTSTTPAQGTRINHLIQLRRLLEELAANGHSLQPDLI